MHALQPTHKILSSEELDKILKKYNISVTQFPKISVKDSGLPEGCLKGDVVEIQRKGEYAETYYRVVI